MYSVLSQISLMHILETIIAALSISIILFIYKEWVFPLPNLNGEWEFEEITNETKYKPYNNIKIRYKAIIWNQTDNIFGTAEKISEETHDGKKREYNGAHRSRVEIRGSIQKNYLSRNRLHLHLLQKGQERESTTFHELIIYKKFELFYNTPTMAGDFFTTAADCRGNVSWKKCN